MNRLPKHPFNREPGFSPVPSSQTAPASPSPVGVGATSIGASDRKSSAASSSNGGASALVASTYFTCPECEGTGFFVSGSFHPDDPRCEATWDCENCDGTGEVDEGSHCQCGEPLDDNFWCASCQETWAHNGALPPGWARVEL